MSSTSRNASLARREIFALLKDDHQRLKKAFKAFDKLHPARDPEACAALVLHTCSELQVHALLEEEWVYPAARPLLATADWIDEAEVDHASAEALIRQLQHMHAEDEKFAATFRVLGRHVLRHVKEEEHELFKPWARSQTDWEGLWAQIQIRRAELLRELLPAERGTSAGRDAGAADRSASSAQGHGPVGSTPWGWLAQPSTVATAKAAKAEDEWR